MRRNGCLLFQRTFALSHRIISVSKEYEELPDRMIVKLIRVSFHNFNIRKNA
jgi:hypothetical protein